MKKLLLTIATLLTVNLCLTAQEPMVLTYNTNLSAGTTITLPLNGTVNVTVNWGDGNEETFTSAGMKNHTFVDEGTYTVQITGTLTRFGGGDFTGYSNAEKLVSVTSFGELGLTSLSYAYSGAKNLISVPSQIPTTVTNLSYMFNNANKFNQDISEWNVSNITDMTGMFRVASTFNQDIGNWDVSNVKNMSNMFNQAVHFNQNLNSWDVSKVTNMWQMFTLAYDFNGIIGDWNVGSVTNISSMFYYATSFNQDISGWNVSKVIDMSSMFCSASAFNQDISNWDVSSVTTMRYLFRQASHFNQDIGGWNVGNVTNMHQMFFLATSFNQDISSWDVGKVTDMSNMFASASKFNQNLGSWNVTSVTNMAYMFDGKKLSTPNYNAILEGWAAQAVKSGVTFSGGSSKYSPGAPEDARAILTETFGWIITDGGISELPAISTSEISHVGINSAISGGLISNDGGTDVIARGVVWNTSANPTIDNNAGITTDGTGVGTFESILTGLDENTTYYVRAYASNESGTDYGIQKTFTTPNPMTLEFNTTLSAGTTVTLPLYGTVNVDVNWGDDTEDSYTTTGLKDHTYSDEGTYAVKISGTLTHFGGGDVLGYTNAEKLVSVSSFGELGLTNLSYAFNGATNLTSVPSDIPATVTNLVGMFNQASKFNQDISSWDVSNITNMAYMFRGASLFNQNVGSWNVSNVTSMSCMFTNASKFNQDLNSWDVSNVTNMWQMFTNASKFNGAIGNWNVSNVTNFSSMFYYATSFNQDIGGWNLSNAVNISQMFSSASAFNQDISKWDVSNVTDMKYLFRQASVFNQNISSWDVGKVTNMHQMFFHANSFNQDISGWDVGMVSDMSYMFSSALSFNQDLGNWNVSNVTKMSYMFDGITLSTAYYNSILESWSAQTVKNNVSLCGGNSKYSPGSAATARGILIDTYGWSITDGGETNLPAITTNSPSEITTTSAISGGNVTADAGSAVTERGVVWHTSKNPTIENNLGITSNGSGLGNFSSDITYLTEYSTYYVRAYAINSNGIAYGPNIMFSTKKEITVEGSFTAYNKTYNGSTSVSIHENYLSLAGLLPEYSDVTISSVTLAFDSPEASQDSKIVSISQIILGGIDAEKYFVSLTGSPTTTAYINKKNVSVSGAVAQNKTYDGSSSAVITGATLAGMISGDDVELANHESGTLAQANVGSGIAVTTNMALTGADKSNYTLSQPSGFLADILPKELTVNGLTGISSKIYDGNSTATVTGNASLSGIVSGDISEVSIESIVANFSDTNIGTEKEVTVTFTLQGSKASNYTVASLTSLTGDILAKELTIDGTFSAANRAYNGTQSASIESNNLTISGVIADEIVNLSPAAAFADKNVGEGKTVNLSNGTTIVGEDSGNYILSFTNAPTSTASIIAKELSVINALVSNKVYDGNVNAVISGAELNGVIEGDVILLENQNSGVFSQKNVGTDIDVTTAMTISGTDASNYTISQQVGLKADITALELTIGGTFTVEDKVYDGTTAATIVENNLILLTPIEGDDVSLINVFAEYENEYIGEDISVKIFSAEIEGTDKNNYTLTLANAPETTGNILEPAPETFTVTFTVSNNKGAVSGATISINEQTLTTNESGVATINLENGTYSYSVSASNFTTYDGSITLDGADISEDVSLVHVGIGENSLANLSAFPNPFSNEINIANAVNANRVIVCNIIGEVVMNVELNQSANIRLETSQLNSGIYMVTILAYDGSRIVKKMIRR